MPFFCEAKTEVQSFAGAENTLFQIHTQIVSCESRENFIQTFQMLFVRFRVYDEIIDIHYNMVYAFNYQLN